MAHQCRLLELPRSSFYHIPKPVTDEKLELMALIDRCHLKHPFYGSRRIRDWLDDQGRTVNRKRIQRLMRTMGLVALYPKRNLSLANKRAQGLSVPAQEPLYVRLVVAFVFPHRGNIF